MARFNAVDVVLWVLRIGVVAVVVIGTVSTLIKGRYNAAQWFDFVMFGLTIGSIYAQIALGYTMVYGVLRLINFAHGDIVMTGAFAGYFVATPLDRSGFLESQPILAMAAILVVAIITSTTIAVLTERIAYRPFRRVVGLAPLICAIGVSFFLEQTFRGMFGSAVKSYPEPEWERVAFNILGFNVPRIDVVVIGLALLFMGALYLIVQRTRMGTAMRAVAEDGEAAALMGIDVNKVVVFTFVLGGAMAGIAGVFYAFRLQAGVFPDGLHPRHQGIRRRGAGRHRQHPRRHAGRFLPRHGGVGRTDAVPRWHRHSRALSVARPDRLHAADHGADLPSARTAGRTHGEKARMISLTSPPFRRSPPSPPSPPSWPGLARPSTSFLSCTQRRRGWPGQARP